jgi:lactate dehydrogenase-like 2-hydroxyacid dehydrogenase
VVCIASTASTQNIVDHSVLSALGKDGIIVNIARGAVIDEPALIAAVRDGSIAGAGLDVFVGEPTINPAFYDLPNTVLAPHQGSATIETRLRMGDIVVTSLGSHFAGKRPAATVN